VSARRSGARSGFSLIEVLVATAILATGLIAASRAALVATTDQGILRDRTLARWVAHNTLAEIRLQSQQAAAGSTLTRQVQQGGVVFVAVAKVSATPSPLFSRVEVSVARAQSDAQGGMQVLAQAVGFSSRQ
jgi:general secretion pathway protein I